MVRVRCYKHWLFGNIVLKYFDSLNAQEGEESRWCCLISPLYLCQSSFCCGIIKQNALILLKKTSRRKRTKNIFILRLFSIG